MAITVLSCADNRADRKEENPVPQKRIENVLKENTGRLMSLPGVVGTAEGRCDGKPCIKVYVVRRSPELCRQIPDTLGGYPVVIEETGEVHTLPENRRKGK